MLNIALQQKSKGDRDVGGGTNPNLSRNDSLLFLADWNNIKKIVIMSTEDGTISNPNPLLCPGHT